jgi:two-component system C4-dicarboxylate transport sensor histidine kinase DctB
MSGRPAAGEISRQARRAWIMLAVACLLMTTVAAFVAREYGQARAVGDLMEQGRTEANLKVALLRAVLERPRALPLVLSEDRDIIDALVKPGPDTIGRLNGKLEGLVKETHAAVIYAIRTDGLAIASSNWREPESFVGNDYSFRDYFRIAMKEGVAEHFALGSVSKRPGLYISRRIGPGTAPLGVVVVKMEFDGLEADWRDTGRPAYIIDRNGVVLITSIPSWRFMTIAKLPAERLAEIRHSLQFGDAPLQPLPFRRQEAIDLGVEEVDAVLPGSGEARLLRLGAPVPSTAWRLEYLLPLEPVLSASAREATLLAIVGVVPIFAIAAVILWRRQAAVSRLARAQQARDELEKRVFERTEDLSRARDMLEAEIAGHRSTEAKLQGVQQELVAANRLAILGQVAAGVAHEINQPVATIRAYADNARVFLDRNQTAPVTENLTAIADLTERIGTITDELKAFARKGRAAAEAVALRDAIEGAVLLLRSRFSGRMEALDIDLPPVSTRVLANRIRLEQVLINLFQNALEALEGVDGARVTVRTKVTDATVSVTVSDNGPGIPEEILEALFTPFNTSKERGLGLGLVISKEILADYGGTIDVETGERGTRFTISLKKA